MPQSTEFPPSVLRSDDTFASVQIHYTEATQKLRALVADRDIAALSARQQFEAYNWLFQIRMAERKLLELNLAQDPATTRLTQQLVSHYNNLAALLEYLQMEEFLGEQILAASKSADAMTDDDLKQKLLTNNRLIIGSGGALMAVLIPDIITNEVMLRGRVMNLASSMRAYRRSEGSYAAASMSYNRDYRRYDWNEYNPRFDDWRRMAQAQLQDVQLEAAAVKARLQVLVKANPSETLAELSQIADQIMTHTAAPKGLGEMVDGYKALAKRLAEPKFNAVPEIAENVARLRQRGNKLGKILNGTDRLMPHYIVKPLGLAITGYLLWRTFGQPNYAKLDAQQWQEQIAQATDAYRRYQDLEPMAPKSGEVLVAQYRDNSRYYRDLLADKLHSYQELAEGSELPLLPPMEPQSYLSSLLTSH